MVHPNFRMIAERSSDGYFRHVEGSGLVYLTQGFSQLLDQDHAALSADPVNLADLIHSSGRDEFEALTKRLLAGQVDRTTAVLQMLKVDGRPIWVELFAVPLSDEEGNVIGFDGLVRDVSEHLEVADLLSQRSLELSALLEAQKALTGSLDFEDTLQAIVNQAKGLLDASLSVIFLLDAESGELKPMADAGSLSLPADDLRFLISEGVSGWVMEHGERQQVNRLSDDPRAGRLLDRLDEDVSLLAVPLRIANTVTGTLTVIGAVDQYQPDDLRLLETLAQVASLALMNSREYRVVEQRATIDGLTGAHNRLFLEENLPSEIERSDRLGYSLALLMIDVDDLKRINDEQGHRRGDQVLQHLVQVLLGNSRETDWVARYGGDEFVVVLPGCSQDDLDRLCRRVQQQLSKSSPPTEFSISIGGAIHQPGSGSAEQLLQLADEAERLAKQDGGDRINIRQREPEAAEVNGEGS